MKQLQPLQASRSVLPAMVPSVVLLSLFGAAALAGVHSASVEKDEHVEEMVTRCIVEVLLNGLSKADAPPINPLCKDLLKKGNQQKEEKKNIGKEDELDTREILEELEKPEGILRNRKEQKEEELKRQAEESEKWHLEGENHGGNGKQQDISQENPYTIAKTHEEEKKDDEEKQTEEDGGHKSEEGHEKKHSEEVVHELPDLKSSLTAERVDVNDYKRTAGGRYFDDPIQSQEKENEESKEEDTEEEEEEEESSEKYHHSFHREYEDSFERGPEAEKRGHRLRHYHRTSRQGSSLEYKKHHNGEKRDSPEESSEEDSEFWNKNSHDPKHYSKAGHHSEEKRNSNEIHGSEEIEEKIKSKQYQDRRFHSKEDSEEEDGRPQSRENEELQHHYERKSLYDESQKELRHHYEQSGPYGQESEDVGKRHSYGSKDEKRHSYDNEQQGLEDLGSQTIDRGEEEQILYNPEERNYPGISPDELEKRYYSERGKHVGNRRSLLIEEGYPRSHYLVQNVKRATAPYMPYYEQLRGKSHRSEKNGIPDPFLEGEEKRRYHLNERDFLPEYNDYDSSWEKKKLMEGLNNKRHKNKDLERIHKFSVKRQYNRMDELAHLLSYRKKSIEFPESYSSKEDVKRGQIISGKGKLIQRPLTQEEEKELENLAAMDLQLQKIAEKINNRRG